MMIKSSLDGLHLSYLQHESIKISLSLSLLIDAVAKFSARVMSCILFTEA